MSGSVVNAFAFLIETLLNLYLAVLLMRVLLEAVEADYYNPVCQVLLKVTQPLVGPLSRLIPSIGHINMAAIVLLFVIQTIAVLLIGAISGQVIGPFQTLWIATLGLVRLLLMMYLVLIIVEVILSWVGGGMRHPIIPLIYQLTRPVLAPIRRVVPPLAGIDLSPLIAIIGIQFLMILIGLR